MPIETILPDATTTPNPAWTTNPHLQLDADDTNFATCAGANVGESFTVSFGNLTSTIGSINSIRFYVIGSTGIVRGVTGLCTFSLLNSSDSSYSYNENKNFLDSTIGTTQAGTERTTSDGSTAWTESDVNGLRMNIKFGSITNASANINIDFLKIDVDYNEASVVLPPIRLSSGLVKLTSGLVKIS